MEEVLRKNIEACMKKQGIRPAELARRSGLQSSTLQGVIGTSSSPRLDTVEAIARGLNEPVGALLGLSKDVAEKERELEEKLRLLSLVPRLNKNQVTHFLSMIESELGIDPDGDSLPAPDNSPDAPKKSQERG